MAFSFKKDDRKVTGNYRPVNLTCIICKVLDSIVREYIVNHMKQNKLLSKNRSTVLQLVQVLDKWTEILDMGG